MDNVKLFRIDYRLLHWQTGVLWVQKLKANMILVAGDKVAADDMRKNLIKLLRLSLLRHGSCPLLRRRHS